MGPSLAPAAVAAALKAPWRRTICLPPPFPIGAYTAEEEAAAAAYRDAHREGPSGDALDRERKIIVSFDSTFDVMECEQLCLDAGVPGRIMPLPGSITAGCGLCWAMPFSGDALAAFRAATEGRITPADYHQLVL